MRSHLKMNNSAVYFHFSYLISDHLCPIGKSLVTSQWQSRSLLVLLTSYKMITSAGVMTIAAISVFDITITLSPCHVARDTCRDSHAAHVTGITGKMFAL